MRRPISPRLRLFDVRIHPQHQGVLRVACCDLEAYRESVGVKLAGNVIAGWSARCTDKCPMLLGRRPAA